MGYGTYRICPVCRWQDDPVQARNPDYSGGANEESLREARANYRRGFCPLPRDSGGPAKD